MLIWLIFRDTAPLNEGHDVNSAAQMKEAIESNGGIPGVIRELKQQRF